MTDLHDLFDRFLPHQLAHAGLECVDRRQRKRLHRESFLALCTLMLAQSQVGQAGIGGIDQVQVSDYSPVPPAAVVAQPQVLLLILDQQFDLPRTLQVKRQLLSMRLSGLMGR